MRSLRSAWTIALQTLLRMLPWSCRTGLVEIGRPGRDAPVLLTGNFGLSVERVKRALEGIDAYLLVANSRGVNVWCAATGGLMTDHDVVSVLKTSGIGERVDHRRVILPQLAATGIEGRVIHRKTGWNVVWGPVRAEDIRAFLARGLEADAGMRRIEFALRERFEMAVAWAFPLSLVALPLALWLWREAALAVVGLVWGLSLLVFLGFPVYARALEGRRVLPRSLPFDLGPRGLVLLGWGLAMCALALSAGLAGSLGWGEMLRWAVVSGAVLAVLHLDLMGSTPSFKSGLHADRLLTLRLDAERCRGAGFCDTVCPRDVFAVDREARAATMPGLHRCVQCGACIVQCPFDALYLESPEGEVLLPETLRRFKLNLMGHRLVATRGSEAEGERPGPD